MRYNFTCMNCGSHELFVEYYYTEWQESCWTSFVKRGTLNIDEHRIEEWEEVEKLESGRDPTVDADANPEDTEEIDEDSQGCYVLCEGCGREIEFGWSHPEGGRIWPSECTDFNPWKCWPEARYRESWRKKNWLRPRTPRKRGGNPDR